LELLRQAWDCYAALDRQANKCVYHPAKPPADGKPPAQVRHERERLFGRRDSVRKDINTVVNCLNEKLKSEAAIAQFAQSRQTPAAANDRDSLRLLLELYGYEVTVAYSGPDGVKAAEQWQPDVVLCDIGLPGLDGYGVASRLRHNPSTAQARLIAVTGYGAEDDKRRTQEVGFDAHLVKPVDPDALQGVLLQEASA
jgi:CheY-like chemotaxis protein